MTVLPDEGVATRDTQIANAVALGHALTKYGSAYQAVILVNDDTTNEQAIRYLEQFYIIVAVRVPDDLSYRNVAYIYTALLTAYERVILCDVNILPLRNFDELAFFELPDVLVQGGDDVVRCEVNEPMTIHGIAVFAPALGLFLQLVGAVEGFQGNPDMGLWP